MHPLLQSIKETTDFLKVHGFDTATTAVVLGTGLGEFVKSIQIQKSIAYNEIPNFPVSTVESHKGNLILGTIGDTKIIAMQGRFHYYEGYTMQEVTFPVRVLKSLSVQRLLLSNAAGGLNLQFKKGDLVLLNDHINTQTENPLRGLTDAAFGPRFPDMSCPYDTTIGEQLHATARQLNIQLHNGVYVAVNGPNLETRAEYKYLKAAGADMVGMSTVPEVIVANQIGLPCAAISVITDECDPENLQKVDIADIIAVANEADKVLSALFVKLIESDS